MSPDPYVASGGPKDPKSWNRYAYVEGDPVNFNDPRGLQLFPAIQDPYGNGNPNASLETPGGGGGCMVDGFEQDPMVCQMLAAAGALVPLPALQAMANVTIASNIAQDAFDSSLTPHCAGLFNLPNGADPLSLLNDPQELSVLYEPLPANIYAKEIGTPGSGHATIIFNTGPGSPFLGATPGNNANTLIHELLHAAIDIFGASAVSPFWQNNDGGSTSAQNSNNTLIQVACGSALGPQQ